MPTKQSIVDQAFVKRLKECDWGQAKKDLEPLFNQIATNSDASYADTQKFFADAGAKLFSRDLTTLLSLPVYERFDFNNDNALQYSEAFKCFKKACMLELIRLGGEPELKVESKTPEKKGYTVGKELNRGGQGAAMRAHHPTFGTCCLKVYNKNDENAGDLYDLIHEMEYLRALGKCEYVMNNFEIFQDSAHLYCANELLNGGDLCAFRDNCRQDGVKVTDSLLRNVFSQCLEALKYIHSHAIIHCDIKEANIMIKNQDYKNPQVCLIDFGLATSAAGEGDSGGTPGYMPPETIQDCVWFPRGDIFSMGVVFFQMLADCDSMWAGSTDDEVEYNVAYVAAPMHLVESRCPGAVPMLNWMLAKDRRARPRSPQLLEEPWLRGKPGVSDGALAATRGGGAAGFLFRMYVKHKGLLIIVVLGVLALLTNLLVHPHAAAKIRKHIEL
eukprot:TRINITY_DN1614_c0_g2_i1.p1 TRINITY_DN1614_c0_g2~~TRINITY_DN1614_c0_g2_i1.p1  ORF type:complete len:458 (+),score=80.51 TRINITY_DN1614_c0_g2_i1:47-1375(+)